MPRPISTSLTPQAYRAGPRVRPWAARRATAPRRRDDKILSDKGVTLVPDFLANSGGVIGSYFEWAQNLQGFFWTEEEYNNRLIHIMKGNFKLVWDYAQAKNVKMRRAAFMAAIQRVADVEALRGIFTFFFSFSNARLLWLTFFFLSIVATPKDFPKSYE